YGDGAERTSNVPAVDVPVDVVAGVSGNTTHRTNDPARSAPAKGRGGAGEGFAPRRRGGQFRGEACRPRPGAEAAAAIAAHIEAVSSVAGQAAGRGGDHTGRRGAAGRQAGAAAAGRAAGAHFPLVAVGRVGGAGRPREG